MSLVAFLAGEPHSDAPGCASPLIQTFAVLVNDHMPHAARQRLKPFAPRIIGTDDGFDPVRAAVLRHALAEEILAKAPGHLTTVDAPLLARLCVALAYADEANAQVQALGLLVKAPNTKLPIQSPWVAIMNRQTEIARRLLTGRAALGAGRSSAAVPHPRRAVRRDPADPRPDPGD